MQFLTNLLIVSSRTQSEARRPLLYNQRQGITREDYTNALFLLEKFGRGNKKKGK